MTERMIVEKLVKKADRNCGSCHACCIYLTIDELQKPDYTPCPHLSHLGCKQYEQRPATCHDFVCLWKMGRFPQDMRPDRCGLLAHLAVNEIGGWGVNVVECTPGALNRAAGVVDECLGIDCRLVTIQYLDGRKRLYSQDSDWIRDIRTKNPKLSVLSTSIKHVDIRVAADGTAVMRILQR